MSDPSNVIQFDEEEIFRTVLGLIKIRSGNDEIQQSGPDESELLFQLRQGTDQLVTFSIPEKKFNAVKLDFTVPQFLAFCHHKNELYLAGGSKINMCLDHFRRITPDGLIYELKPMITPKRRFPMTSWEEGDALVTLGGHNGSEYLD